MKNDAKKTAHSYTPAIKFSQEFVAVIADMHKDPRQPPNDTERARAEGFLAGVISAARHFGGAG